MPTFILSPALHIEFPVLSQLSKVSTLVSEHHLLISTKTRIVHISPPRHMLFVAVAHPDIAALAPGMYCWIDLISADQNANDPTALLNQLSIFACWSNMIQAVILDDHDLGILALSARDALTVQLAVNQAFSNLSYGDSKVMPWAGGGWKELLGLHEAFRSPDHKN